MKMEKIDLVMFDLKQTTSPDTNLDNLIITELEPDNFLIECNSNDPFHGFVYRLKITETETRTPGNQPSIWKRMYDKFKSSLPSIGKLVAKGLISALPGYKPGLALAGTILNSALSSGNTPMTLG